jgi:hypothetical protein
VHGWPKPGRVIHRTKLRSTRHPMLVLEKLVFLIVFVLDQFWSRCRVCVYIYIYMEPFEFFIVLRSVFSSRYVSVCVEVQDSHCNN